MKKNGCSVSVVIPVYNGRSRIKRMLPLFETQDFGAGFEVIVVDDGSGDDTLAFLQGYKSTFEFYYYTHSRNKGRAAACNAGILASKGDVIVITDDDMAFNSSFITQHSLYHLQNKRLGVIGMVRINPPAARSIFAKNLLKNERDAISRNLLKKDDLGFSGCATGNFSIRRETMHEVGFFDENFKVYGFEDWELGFRLKEAGVRLVYAPEVLAWHDMYALDFKKFCQRRALVGYSAAHFYRKHPETKNLLEIDSVFMLRGGLLEKTKKMIKALFINAVSVYFFDGAIYCIEKIIKHAPRFLYDQVSAYHYRKGLKKAIIERG